MSDEPKREEPFGVQARLEEGLPANYGGAMPEEVALAVLRYRPGEEAQAANAKRTRVIGQERSGR